MAKELVSPAIILAGVRKCGTTSLFDMLARHSRIAPAAFKESQFFACDPRTVMSNLDWYAQLFSQHSGSSLLDGSTWYFGSENTPELIADCLPNARVVLCIRDPVKRTFSGYLHMKKQTPSKDLRSFEEILTSTESLVHQGISLYEAEDHLLSEAVANKTVDADYIGSDFHKGRFRAPFETHLADRRFSFRYFAESSYRLWLPKWERVFGDRLLIVIFEELMNDPAAVIGRILEFGNLEFEEAVAVLSRKNETRLPKNWLTRSILAFRRAHPVGRGAALMLKRAGFKPMGRALRERWLYADKERLSPLQVSRASELLRAEYDYWRVREPRCERLWANPTGTVLSK